MNEQYSKEKLLKVVTLFSGIGAQEAALKRLRIPFEIVGYSEIDKFAIQSYTAIWGEQPALGDITKIEKLPKCDLMTYSFCCQDISVCGKQKGLIDENGNQTRSGLLFEVERLLEVAKLNNELPKYLLLENVKNLVGKKFKPDFDRWLNKLDKLGYNTYWKVLNSKDFLIPQNRERVFAISIRKDIDIKGYTFPEKKPLQKRLKDILEEKVDEKYYLSNKCIQGFLKHNNNHEAKGTGFLWKPRDLNGNASCLRANGALAPTDNTIVEPLGCASRGRNPSDRTSGIPTEQRLEINENGISNCLTTVQKDSLVLEPKIIQLGNIVETGNWDNPQRGRIYSSEGLSPTLNCMQGGGTEPKIIVGSNQKHAAVNTDGIVPTLTSAMGCGGGHIPMHNYDFRIRKLTPKECWRLQAFTDEEFNKAKNSGVSDTQLYKQAGNSITVTVLMALFFNLFRGSVSLAE